MTLLTTLAYGYVVSSAVFLIVWMIVGWLSDRRERQAQQKITRIVLPGEER